MSHKTQSQAFPDLGATPPRGFRRLNPALTTVAFRLGQARVTIVDAIEFSIVIKKYWFCAAHSMRTYEEHQDGRLQGKKVYKHREVLGKY